MKKLALSVILGASLMVTPSAFGLTAMSDSNMKSATGQAGVSIAIDDVTLYQKVGETFYNDTDGLTGLTASANGESRDGGAAGVFVTGAETLTTIRAIFAGETDREHFLAHNYDQVAADNGFAFTSKALTIDVTDKAYLMTTGKATNLDTYIANHVGASDIDNDGDTDGIDALAIKLEEKGIKKAFNYATNGKLAGYKTQLTALVGSEANADALITAAKPQANEAYADWKTRMDATLNGMNAALSTSVVALGIAGYTPGVDTWASYANDLDTDLAVAGVVIGLPTIEVRKTGSIKTIGVRSDIGSTKTYNSGDAFITIKKSDSTLAILDGYIEICPH